MTARPKPLYKYYVRRLPREVTPSGKIAEIRDTESMSGQVQGLKASDLEERFAKALSKNKAILAFSFRKPLIAQRWMPGEVELDFDVLAGPLYQPVQIDGPFAHHTAQEKAVDALKDAIINDRLKGDHFPVIRITTANPQYNVNDLTTQEGADALVARMFR